MALALPLVIPGPAYAHPGCGQRHLFVYNNATGSSASTGDAGTILIRDFELDLVCNDGSIAFNGPNRHSTAHIRTNPNAWSGPFVEVGYLRGLSCSSSGQPLGGCETNRMVKRTWFFVEGFNGSNYVGPYFFDTNVALGTWIRFKVQVIDGTTRWRFWWDECLNGCSPTELKPAAWPNGMDVGFATGYPAGETTVRGDTSAYDHHVNLWRRSVGQTWSTWPSGMAPGIDENYGYHSHRLSNTEYETHAGEPQHIPL